MNERKLQTAASSLGLRHFLRVLRSLVLLAVAIAIVLWGTERLRRMGQNDRCRMQLNRVAIALRFLHEEYSHLPPPYLTDDSGAPIHSWRILAMRYLVDGPGYDFGINDYKFNEPWDSPNNTQVRNEHAFYDYSCPIAAKGSHNANCLCVVGSALWPLPKMIGEYWNVSRWPNPKEGGVFPPHGKAILLVEVAESDIPWTKPTDISLSELVSLLRDDPSGDQFRRRISHVVAVDAVGTPFILDPVRDIEAIKKLVESEAAAKTEQGQEEQGSEVPERKAGA